MGIIINRAMRANGVDEKFITEALLITTNSWAATVPYTLKPFVSLDSFGVEKLFWNYHFIKFRFCGIHLQALF
jgi:hypothetical protein